MQASQFDHPIVRFFFILLIAVMATPPTQQQQSSSATNSSPIDSIMNDFRCKSGKMPMWSLGYSRSCCDLYPKHMNPVKSFFEKGDPEDPQYIYKNRQIKNGDAVYVVTSDLPYFVTEVFMKLPMTTKIVLVTGAEDIGAPYEIFHPNRPNFFDYTMSALWPNRQKTSLKDFLGDPRLGAWIAQNWDLVGCNIYTCSSIQSTDKALVSKVIPLPIGLDLHSASEKKTKDDKRAAELVCEQLDTLHAERQAAVPFSQRLLVVLAEFHCSFDDTRIGMGRKQSRGEICNLIKEHQLQNPRKSNAHEQQASYGPEFGSGVSDVATIITHQESVPTAAGSVGTTRSTKAHNGGGNRSSFWHRLGSVAFALSPSGFGVDTHRTWEILHMGAVPIVLKSPLDRLHRQFPIVVVERWTDVFVPGALGRFRDDIRARFPLFAGAGASRGSGSGGGSGNGSGSGSGSGAGNSTRVGGSVADTTISTVAAAVGAVASAVAGAGAATGGATGSTTGRGTNDTAWHMLTADYWIDVVRQEKRKILREAAGTRFLPGFI